MTGAFNSDNLDPSVAEAILEYEQLKLHESFDAEDFVSRLPEDVARQVRTSIEDDVKLRRFRNGDCPDTSQTQASQTDNIVGRLQQIGFENPEFLAMGGYGSVYKATHPHLKRKVAIKVLSADKATSPQEVERFRAEAVAAARLTHPNIVHVNDVFDIDQRPCIEYDFVEGAKLTTIINDEGYSLHRRVQVVRDLAKALAYAHSKGVFHRDIKPDNVLLDSNGIPLLIDFGLAQQGDAVEHVTLDASEPPLHPSASKIPGTPLYTAPEHFVGTGNPNAALCDQYSLGVMLYELLARRRPFDATSLPELFRIHNAGESLKPIFVGDRLSTKPCLRADQERIQAVCLKAMAKEPESRYANMEEFAQDLNNWLAIRPIIALKEGWRRRHALRFRRDARFMWMVSAFMGTVSALALILVGLATVLWNRGNTISEQKDHIYKDRDLIRAQREEVVASQEMLNRVTLQAVRTLLDLASNIGESDEALQGLRTVSRHLRQLATQISDNRWHELLGLVEFHIGKLHWARGDLKEAETNVTEAVQLLKRFGKSADLIGALVTHAQILENSGKVDAALTLFDEADNTASESQKNYPDDLRVRTNGLIARGESARIRSRQGNYGQATQILDEVGQELLDLVKENPTDPRLYRNLGANRHNLAVLLTRANRNKEAKAVFDLALKFRTAYVSRFPENRQAIADICDTYNEYVKLLIDERDLEDADELADKAEGFVRGLLVKEPTIPSHLDQLGTVLHNRGKIAQRQRKWEESLVFFDDARQVALPLVEKYPEVPIYRRNLGVKLNARAFSLWKLGKSQDSLDVNANGMEYVLAACKMQPTDVKYSSAVIHGLKDRKLFLADLGRVIDDDPVFGKAKAVLPEVFKEWEKALDGSLE